MPIRFHRSWRNLASKTESVVRYFIQVSPRLVHRIATGGEKLQIWPILGATAADQNQIWRAQVNTYSIVYSAVPNFTSIGAYSVVPARRKTASLTDLDFCGILYPLTNQGQIWHATYSRAMCTPPSQISPSSLHRAVPEGRKPPQIQHVVATPSGAQTNLNADAQLQTYPCSPKTKLFLNLHGVMAIPLRSQSMPFKSLTDRQTKYIQLFRPLRGARSRALPYL